MLQGEFGIQLFQTFEKNGLESEGMVQEMNVHIFETVFSDSTHISNCQATSQKIAEPFSYKLIPFLFP